MFLFFVHIAFGWSHHCTADSASIETCKKKWECTKDYGSFFIKPLFNSVLSIQLFLITKVQTILTTFTHPESSATVWQQSLLPLFSDVKICLCLLVLERLVGRLTLRIIMLVEKALLFYLNLISAKNPRYIFTNMFSPFWYKLSCDLWA